MPIALAKADKKILAKRRSIVSGLRKLVKKENVISDDVGRMVFSSDAMQTYRQLPLAVVLPETTKDVAEVIKYCNAKGLKVVPRGAGTSLTGSALPSEDTTLICLSRMDNILKVNYDNRTIKVQAGVRNQSVTDAISSEGFFYAPDPASGIASTIAGNIATNAGGPRSLKYGSTAQNILGVQFVTMDGEVLNIGGEYLDPMEYDLLSLVCGSEGQLGIITEAILRILPKKDYTRPIMIGFPSVSAAIGCVGSLLSSGIIPVAMELMDKLAIQLSEEFIQAGYPQNAEAVLIVEVEGSPVEIDRQLADINNVARNHEPIVVRISENEEESESIWRGRRSLIQAIGKISDYYIVDGTIPPGMLQEVLNQIKAICSGYNLRGINTFRAGDGTLNSMLIYDANNPEEVERAEMAGAEILKLCVGAGGGLSGELGVGIEKRDLMNEQFTQQELRQQMKIKDAFDPEWRLNPGKVFPLEMHR